MREIKYRYTCQRDNGHTFSQIFTLEQIEQGAAKRWIDLNFVGMFHLKRDAYTGLKDKNGKEIYEGDILADVGVDEYNILGIVRYGDDGVTWTSGSYYLADKGGYATDWAFEFGGKPDSWDALEVIGNIYENSELLKGEG